MLLTSLLTLNIHLIAEKSWQIKTVILNLFRRFILFGINE